MKKRIAVVFFTLLSMGLFSFVMIAKTGKVGYTGSPGENACNNCHNSFPLNSGTGSISFNSNIPGDNYTPDSVYQISVIVRKSGVSLFGFGLEALKTGNTNTGTFTVTDVVRTQQLTSANGRKNMTHKLNGGASSDSAVFIFDWKAPSTNVGNITFYYSGVCANNNNANTLDYVYKGSHTISSTSTFGMEEIKPPYADLKVRPFPSGGFVEVHFLLEEYANIQLKLISLDGKVVKTELLENQYPGEKTFTIYTSGINTGLYILQAEINDIAISRKFMLLQ